MDLSATHVGRSPAVAIPRRGGRVLLVSELFPPAIGGSATLFHGIYSRLGDADVKVLTDRTAPAAGDERQEGLAIVRRAMKTTRWGVLHPPGLTHHLGVALHIRSLVPRRRAVVHCARALPEGVAAWLARLSGGPRYVCWAHGEDLMMARTSRELTFLTRAIYRGAAASIANSRNTAALIAELGVAPERIHVVYPAVDGERFHPNVDGTAVRRRYASPDEVLLLSVGRLQRRKGHDVAIQAMAALRDQVPQLKYVIAGSGEERPRLERMAAELGLADRVVFAGVVPDGELPAHYAACDIFLMPNRVDEGDIEGFGIVFLEAGAAGRPVIGGDSGGVPEAVEHGASGLLVRGEDPAAVAAAIRVLAASPALRARMGRYGRSRALAEFSWDRAASVVSSLQARLIGD